MTVSSATAANVALGKTARASVNSDNAKASIDDNLGTRWESTAADGDNQWFYVDLGESTNIDHLKIVWEGAYGKHYKIHIADELTEAMALKLTDDDKTNDFAEGWTEVAEIDKTLTAFPASETIPVSTTDVVTARYVAIELIERGTQWGFSFWEFGVYDIPEEVAKLSAIEITSDKLQGYAADTYTLGYKFLDQYKMNYILTAEENASRQFTVSEGATLNDNKLTVTGRGTYTVKMKIGDVESNELKIDVKAEGANLALKKNIVFATEGSKSPESAVDGNFGSIWETPEPAGTENHEYDAELVVDLGEVYDVNCIHTAFEGATSADYTITFSTDNVTFSEPIAAFTVTNGIGMTKRHDWLTSNDAIKARYVKFHSTRAATEYGTKLYELEVYTNSKSELTSTKISADKECGLPGDYTFTLKGLDQFGGDYDLSTDKGTWTTSNGSMNGNVLTADKAGAYEVYYTTEGGIQSNTVTIAVVNPKGDNLALNRPVTVSDGNQTGDSKPESAVDGVDAASSVWGAAEPAGSIDHTYDCWIVVELEKAFKIEAVKTSWEGANSCQYTVAASTDGENFTTFGTYDKAAKQEFRTDWFAGNGIEAKYIKVYSTKASTGYGTKLQELYVYDVDGTTSSVAAIAAEGKIFVAGNEVVLPEGTTEATVFNLNGAAVARTAETTLSIANLQAGVYAVKAVKADGSVVAAKIVK